MISGNPKDCSIAAVIGDRSVKCTVQSDSAVVKIRRDSRDGSVSSQTPPLHSPNSGHSGQEMHLRRFD